MDIDITPSPTYWGGGGGVQDRRLQGTYIQFAESIFARSALNLCIFTVFIYLLTLQVYKKVL
jgi:hypothetical protein